MRNGNRIFLVFLSSLVLLHLLDLIVLPFGTMCDSLAYSSYGFDMAGANLTPVGSPRFPPYSANPYFPVGYPLILAPFIYIWRETFMLPLFIFQHTLLLLAQIIVLCLLRSRTVLLSLAFLLFAFVPEFHIYPQTIMSEAVAIPTHLLAIIGMYHLINKDPKGWWIIYFISAVLVISVRMIPFALLGCIILLLVLGRTISIVRGICLAVPVFVALFGVLIINYLYVGHAVITTSSGKHLHDRTVFSHQFPLLAENEAQKKILELIGEEKYRRPHWEVEGALQEKGLDVGFEVDSLLKRASAPYITRYPTQFLLKTLHFSWKTLTSDNLHEFEGHSGFVVDDIARSHQIYLQPFGNIWARYVKEFKQNFVGWIYLLVNVVLLPIIVIRSSPKNRIAIICFALYPLIGIFISSTLSWDDPRRLREFFLVMVSGTFLLLQILLEGERLSALPARVLRSSSGDDLTGEDDIISGPYAVHS